MSSKKEVNDGINGKELLKALAVLSEEKDELSKATSKFIKRCIIAVAIFFIPTVLNYLLYWLNEFSKTKGASTCEVGAIIRMLIIK